VNLNQLQIFCTVARHLSFSVAAEELFITQPAVSQQVKGLERQLNVKLFERLGHKLFLTEAGEAILASAQAILTARAEMEQSLALLRGSMGRLALGANTTGGMYVAPAIVRAFRELNPEAEATLQVETTNRICERVMQNMIDVAVVTGPVEDRRFVVRDLLDDEVYLIVSPSHPFAPRASVSPREVAAEDFAVPEPGSRTRTLIEGAFLERGLRIRVTMQLPGTEAVKKAVEANLGVAMVSKYAVSRELALGALCRVVIDGLTLHRPIHVLHRKGKHLSPLARRFLAFAHDFVAREEHVSGPVLVPETRDKQSRGEAV
jgi:LysR family transcriptional regulator, transcriptional activator of the cysJI operon